MGIHRSEMLQTPDGQLSIVEYVSTYEHVGPVREAILQLKYKQDTSQAIVLAQKVVGEVRHLAPCDLVTWAPTTFSRRQHRGFDQSEIIARHVAASLKKKHARLLRRVNDGRQTGSGREERLSRPRFVSRPHLHGQCIWVIDDVMTTGATLRASAEALVQSGAHRVLCVAVSYVR